MILRLTSCLVVLALCAVCAGDALAETYQLLTGETLSGEPVSFDEKGVVVKKADGTFASRVSWTNFTQDALKQLSTFPKARLFTEGLIEEEEDAASKKAVEITPKPVPRLERLNRKASLGVLFASPLSVAILFILYLANVYAAYEISVFRNYPAPLVCGVAALAPLIGPIIFLSLPTKLESRVEEVVQEVPREHVMHDDQSAAFEMSSEPQASASAPSSPHASPRAISSPPPATIYHRGHTTFNRRFFETKLAGFLRVVPSDAEKDLVIQIKSARGEFVGSRISRIMPNELFMQINKGGASSEVIIPFTEINEVKVRHKDA